MMMAALISRAFGLRRRRHDPPAAGGCGGCGVDCGGGCGLHMFMSMLAEEGVAAVSESEAYDEAK